MKARLQAEAYALAGIDAMLPSAGELALGADFVTRVGEEHGLPWVAANLECGGKRPFPPSRTVERGGVRMTFVGVVGENVKAEGCAVTDALASAKAAVGDAEGDVVVLLSGQEIDADERLSAALPGVDLVVNGAERRQLQAAEPLPNGGLHLAAGSRGKHLGVVELSLVPGAKVWRDDGALGPLAEKRDRARQRVEDLEARLAEAKDDKTRERLQKQVAFYTKEREEAEGQLFAASEGSGPAHRARNTLVALSASVPDHAATAALVAAAKAQIEKATPVAGGPSALAEGPFAGSSACTACHAKEAAQWSGTAHARAWASLQEAGRSMDRECFSCHVTGAQDPDGPKDPGAVAGLENVGCEACHGPGDAHVADPKTDMVRDPGEAGCVVCHDGQQDGGRFVYATYRPKVLHGG